MLDAQTLSPTKYPHIALTEKNVPVIQGTTTKVIEIVLAQRSYGWTAEEIRINYQYLSMGQIYAALAYYWDNQQALDADVSSSQSEVPLLQKMVEVIVEVTEPVKIILFGSRAKGTATTDSDYDFLIVKERAYFEVHSRRKETGKLRRALSKFRVSKDILMYSLEEVEERSQWRNSVVVDALGEGKLLYERF